MTMNRRRFFYSCMLTLLGVLAVVGRPNSAKADDNVSKGTIGEMGYGKFKLNEKNGLTRLYLLGKQETSYDPAMWRPGSGDQVEVTFYENKGKLVASAVRLIKLGPNSVDPKEMTSPMKVVVIESGKSGFFATRKGSPKRLRFSFARRQTQFDPVGWKPQAGEEIEVEFETKPSTFKYDIAYEALRITRIK